MRVEMYIYIYISIIILQKNLGCHLHEAGRASLVDKKAAEDCDLAGPEAIVNTIKKPFVSLPCASSVKVTCGLAVHSQDRCRLSAHERRDPFRKDQQMKMSELHHPDGDTNIVHVHTQKRTSTYSCRPSLECV